MFRQNVGSIDRGIRAIAGIVLLISTFVLLNGFWKTLAAVMAVILLITAIFGVCPLYSALGIDTTPTKPAAKH
ncbi:MAG: DUF2892 domain-containing protein [Roseiflexus sp.]|nr:DUF2892 domain-containing protein [Roseiflexus sp.]MBO9334526.1 DUF2892 domain-containing protein [Roseiflexus sp.]MBO9364840.1 DUF2892 domain-containing protein [Roseiflexus sp.]MBO9381092.1 DUF2892 domain-containing protein [Roseiflexus sp.]MBO9391180.1 DUF2892 domain-containing protein [Roseiflexus sp.]